jgi:hypothetical protein
MSNAYVYDPYAGTAFGGSREDERQGTNREAAEVTASHLFLTYLAVSSRWLTMGL